MNMTNNYSVPIKLTGQTIVDKNNLRGRHYLIINTRQEVVFLVRQLEQLRLLPLWVDDVDGVVAFVGVREQRQEQPIESLTTANQTQ